MSEQARRPNVVFIMADQMAAPVLPIHGHPLVRMPNLSALADGGVVFDAAYCNSPICAPSRCSLLTGRLPTSIGAYDNASEFQASLPTLMHYLDVAGYRTILAGKMHFIGPDQLHGFHERLMTDIYPADFSWTPDWREGPRNRPSGISMQNVTQAGVCVRSLQMDYDDEVEHLAVQKIFDLARSSGDSPFFLTVSFSHPHPPFTIDRAHWDLYDHARIDMPAVSPVPVAERDQQSQWLHASHRADVEPVTDEQVRNARHAYYGMLSYVDDKLGHIVRVLSDCGLRDDTIVIFASDHGEMLGERGMWYKQSFFESSVRVPLVVNAPRRFGTRRVAEPVSLLDLLPTVLDACGATPPEWIDPIAGTSLVPLLEGHPADSGRSVISEYTDMGVCAPCRMIRSGCMKYIYVHGAAAQLYDLERDPRELDNLCGDARYAEVESQLRTELLAGWDPDAVLRDVLASQRRRLFIKSAQQASPAFAGWDYLVTDDDRRRFVRASGAAGAKARARFPFVPPEGSG